MCPNFQVIYSLFDTKDTKMGLQMFAANDRETHATFRALGRPEWIDKPE